MDYYTRAAFHQPFSITDFKGNPVVKLSSMQWNSKPFIFGLSKAKVIIDNIEVLREANSDNLSHYKYPNGIELEYYESTIRIPMYWVNQIMIHQEKIKEFIASKEVRVQQC